MKRKDNAFLTFWPWLLPIGLAVASAGLILGGAGVVTEYWSGFMLGLGAFLALIGFAMLVARLYHHRKGR